jgi:soluble lytic murein transglycosylase-like protein
VALSIASRTLLAALALSSSAAPSSAASSSAASSSAASSSAASSSAASSSAASSSAASSLAGPGVGATAPRARATRPPRLWIWFEEDGTPVVSDRRDSPYAEPYRLGTFEEVLLRQQGAPHAGFTGVAPPNVPPAVFALADSAARKYAVDRALVLAVIGVESGYRSGLISRAGARGLMQLMPETAADLQVDPDVDAENVDGGTRFLAWLLRYFDDERLAVAAYNAGPGRVKRAGNNVPAIPETIAYVDAVLALRDAFAGRGW